MDLPATDPSSRILRVFAALAITMVVSIAGSADAAQRRALLIGINDYLALPDLRGAVNDVELIRSVLVQRYGFELADIEVLVDEQATRDGILTALRAIAAKTDPEDLVYIHYSGHGSQVFDHNGDEAEDQRDETLVSHDGRTERTVDGVSQRILDITDDELGEILGTIATSRVIVVLDSCHSGTATRGASGLRRKWVAPDDPALYRTRALATRQVVPLASQRHLLLSGAADDQEALDGPIDGQMHGLFSYALGRSLASSPRDAGPTQIFDGVERELERIRDQLGLAQMPEPQLEAERENLDRPLFALDSPSAGDAGDARLPWVEVRREGPETVRLLQGRHLGALPGALWAIYPAGDNRFEPSKALALAEIETVERADSIARLRAGGAPALNGMRAVPVSPPASLGEVPVHVLGANTERIARIQSGIRERLPSVRFVEAGAFSRFILSMEGTSHVQVLGSDGRVPIARLDATLEDRLIDGLVRLFARSITAAELMTLDNASTSIQLMLDAAHSAPAQEVEGDEDGTKISARTAARRFRIRRGPHDPRSPENSLQLRVRSNLDCFLTLIDLDSEGGLSLLFPNAPSERSGFLPNGQIEADRDILIPDSLTSPNAAGFFIDYAPPAGTDTVRAFCMATAEGAEAFRRGVAGLDPLIGTRAGLSSIRHDLAEMASRGLRISTELEADETDAEPATTSPDLPSANPTTVAGDWTATSITIEVTE